MLLSACFITGVANASGSSGQPQVSDDSIAPLTVARFRGLSADWITAGRFVARFDPGVDPSEASAVITRAGGRVLEHHPALNAFVVTAPVSDTMMMVGTKVVLASGGAACYVEPDSTRQIDYTPTDPQYRLQKGAYEPLGLPAVWDRTKGSSQVIVAVIDTGVDLDHPEFAGRLVTGYDFGDEDSSPNDPLHEGHGTHVAGTIAANMDNGHNGTGVAPRAKIMPLKVEHSGPHNGLCGCLFDGLKTSDICQAILYAADHGADVINMSFGGTNYSQYEADCVAYALSMDVVVCAATGNDGENLEQYPASFPGVIGVGSVGYRGDVAPARSPWEVSLFSNRGAICDIVAPGEGIWSTAPPGADGGGFTTGSAQYMSGTSMATPHVAGVVALIRSAHPELNRRQTEAVLLGSVDDLGAVGRDDYYGHGMLNPYRALGDAPDSYEPDGAVSSARASTLGAQYGHTFAPLGDRDFRSFSAVAGRVYRIRTSAAAGKSATLTLYGTNGTTVVASRNSGAGGTASIDWTAPASGRYYFENRDSDRLGGRYTTGVEDITPTDAYEGDNTYGTATRATVGTVYEHTLSPRGESDYHYVDAAAGKVYGISVDGQSIGSKPHLYLYGSSGVTVIQADESGYFPSVNWSTVAAGRYYFAVKDPDGAGGAYTVELIDLTPDDGKEPDNSYTTAKRAEFGYDYWHDAYPAGDADYHYFDAVAGATYEIFVQSTVDFAQPHVYLYGTNGTTVLAQDTDSWIQLTWTAPASGRYYFAAKDEHNVGGAYQIRVSDVTQYDVHEPDNTPAQANRAVVGAEYQHSCAPVGDVDYRYVDVVAGRTYAFSIWAWFNEGSAGMYLYEADGTTLIAANPDGYVTWTATSTGRVCFAVRDTNLTGGGYGVEVLDLTPPGDDLEPDNTPVQARQATTDAQSYTHSFEPLGEADYHYFDAVAGNSYYIDANGFDAVEPYLTLYDRDGSTLLATGSTWDSHAFLSWTAPVSGRYYFAATDKMRSGGVYGIFIWDNTPSDAYESDGTYSTARKADIATAYEHSLAPAGDTDFRYIDAVADHTYVFSIDELRFDARPTLTLLGQDGTTVIAADTSAYPQLRWTPSLSGRYFYSVSDPESLGGGYKIRVADTTPQGGRIAGTVSGLSGSLEGIDVTAYCWDTTTSAWTVSQYARTDAVGTYLIAGLPVGDYRIGFSDHTAAHVDEFYDDAKTLSEALDVTVAGDAVISGIDAELAHGGRITGRVSDTSGSLEGVLVTAFSYEPDGGYWNVAGQASADASGLYQLHGLSTGPYRLRFDDPDGNHFSAYFPDTTEVEDASDVAVVEGAVTGDVDCVLEGAGGIDGAVSAGGEPIEGVRVEAHMWDDAIQTWTLAGEAKTDDGGQYAIGPLEFGSYRVAFDSSGSYVDEWFDDVSSIDFASDVFVTPGATMATVDATLEIGARLEGGVSGPEGALPGIRVTAYRWDGLSEAWADAGETFTADDGRFVLEGLPAGQYRVGCLDDSGRFAPGFWDAAQGFDSANSIGLEMGAVVENIDLSLVSAGRITGKVMGTAGGLGGVTVSVFGPVEDGACGGVVDTTITRSDGTYEVSGLSAGVYRVGFSDGSGDFASVFYGDARQLDAAADVRVSSGADTCDIDVTMPAAGLIAGRVSAPGSHLGQVMVMVDCWNETEETWDYFGESWSLDANGDYVIPGLSAGRYRLSFLDKSGTYLSEWYDDARDPEAAVYIELATGQRRYGVDAVLSPAAHITGSVRGPEGPVSDIWIEAYRWNDSTSEWEIPGYARTEADGSYDMGDLEAGTYRVGFSDETDVLVSEFYHDQPSIATATDLVLVNGDTYPGVDAQLDLGGSVSGTVRDESGAPVLNLYVEIAAVTSEDAEWRWVAVTQEDGTYTVGGLPGDDYLIRFIDHDLGRFRTEYYDDRGTLEAATLVSVTLGTRSEGVDATLAPDSEAPVTTPIVDPIGWTRSGVSVSFVYSDDSGWMWGGEWTRYRVGDGPLTDYSMYDPPILITEEGTTTIAFQSMDRAGHLETTKTVSALIDRTAPRTVASAESTYEAGMTSSIALAATDVASGVAATKWRLNGEQYVTGESVPVPSSPGPYQLEYYSVDRVGNQEQTRSLQFNVVRDSGIVTRVSGSDRFGTAVASARQGWDPASDKSWPGVEHVIIANGENGREADPLSAAGLAGVYDAPVLTVSTTQLPASVKTVITEIAARRKAEGKTLKIHLVGGTVVVPNARWTQIRAIPGVYQTKDRIAGGNRYATSAEVAKRIVSVAGADSIPGVILIAGDDGAAFYDALSVSPIAFANTMPMLSVKKNAVPGEIRALLNGSLADTPRFAASSSAYIAGSLSDVTRLATSSNRNVASRQIATEAVARGWLGVADTALASTIPDSLTGGAFLGRRNGVMLFTAATSSMNAEPLAFITANKADIANGWILGGPAVVPASQETSFRNLVQ